MPFRLSPNANHHRDCDRGPHREPGNLALCSQNGLGKLLVGAPNGGIDATTIARSVEVFAQIARSRGDPAFQYLLPRTLSNVEVAVGHDALKLRIDRADDYVEWFRECVGCAGRERHAQERNGGQACKLTIFHDVPPVCGLFPAHGHMMNQRAARMSLSSSG